MSTNQLEVLPLDPSPQQHRQLPAKGSVVKLDQGPHLIHSYASL